MYIRTAVLHNLDTDRGVRLTLFYDQLEKELRLTREQTGLSLGNTNG